MTSSIAKNDLFSMRTKSIYLISEYSFIFAESDFDVTDGVYDSTKSFQYFAVLESKSLIYCNAQLPYHFSGFIPYTALIASPASDTGFLI